MADVTIWTIGHSNHPIERFLGLLAVADIDVVADLRSQPYSRFNPHFNRDDLRAALVDADIGYVFLGEELGGRPREPDCYDDEGYVLYGEVARTDRFRAGLSRLVAGATDHRVAMLCSEEDPTDCHRRLLVTRVLMEEGAQVKHLRGNGSVLSEDELVASTKTTQGTLFAADDEEPAWRSTRSVSPSTRPRASSRN